MSTEVALYGQPETQLLICALDVRDACRGLHPRQQKNTTLLILSARRTRSPQRVAFSMDAVLPTIRLCRELRKWGSGFHAQISRDYRK